MRMKLLLLLLLLALRPVAALLSFGTVALQTNVMIVWTTWSLFARLVSSAPAPPELLINEETKQCYTAFMGDECHYCYIHYGWKSIGNDYYEDGTCPEGYTNVDGIDAIHCVGSRGSACCSEDFSGSGDCDYLVFNPAEEKCSISLCTELPTGWTRDLPEGSYGKCPYLYDSFIDPEDFDCEDPCKNVSTCGECLDKDCMWSLGNENCLAISYSCPSCLSSSSFNSTLNAELCEEFSKVERDNAECEEKTSCEDCLATRLPSDDSKSCRWVNTCAGDGVGVNCERCFASSCSEACKNMNDCSDSNVCDADFCTDCLDKGCFWILEYGSSCYRSCPENRKCAHHFEGDGYQCSAEACKDFESAFFDYEHCISKTSCNNCLQSTLPSDQSKTCKWCKDAEVVVGGCSLECPQYIAECEEVTSCGHGTCDDCLSDGCYWDAEANTCEEGCSPDAAMCLSPDEVPDTESFLEYCLQFGKRRPWADCEDVYYNPGLSWPCPHCLNNGCAWDEGLCRDNCTDGTDTCTTIADLKGDESLESKISAFCAEFEVVECPSPQCIEVEVNFDTDAAGNPLSPGTCVGNEWAAYGLTLVASGGDGDLPCLFDTANPVTGKHGDPDLGAPNQRCPGGGPGIGEGGKPGGRGPNCEPLGNVLVIQEPGTNGIPDDNVDGGLITFTFSPVAEYVKEIGLLDVDYETTIFVLYKPENGEYDKEIIIVPTKGDNSYQVVPINTSHVTQIVLSTKRSLAVTSLSFCYQPEVAPAACDELVTVDFNKDAEGNTIEAGRYVKDEWLSLGMTLQAKGGENTLPRIFDSGNPGGETRHACGDSDLGTPNEKCSKNPGPGRGIGGEPGSPGENCEPLGNVLIVQEPGSECPDDNVDGGIVTLDFSCQNAQYVKEIGLIDIDYKTNVIVSHETEKGLEEYSIQVGLLGDNSVQTVNIDQANVIAIKVVFSRSGGITFVTFCPMK